MKRPKQHQIEDRAYEQFKTCLPKCWVVRDQTHDYGIDREVEIFNQEANGGAVSTGYIFKVQVKGKEHVEISKNNNVIKFSLEINRTNYLCNEINIPAFFILVDVNSNKTWWYAIQLDKELRARLNIVKENKQGKITLNIPANNVLPDTLNSLVTTLDDIKMSHACDSFVELPQHNFNNLSLGIDELTKLEKKFTDKVFDAKVTKLWNEKNYNDLEKVAKETLSNVNSSTSTKVSAILCIEKACEHKIYNSPILQTQFDKICFKTAIAIKKITQKENTSWKLFSAIVWRAALLQIACSSDFALYINRKMHDAAGNNDGLEFFCNTMLGVARQRALKKVSKIYNQCLRLINLALKLKEYWMISQVVLRVAHALPPFFMHLWGEKLEETANLFRDIHRDLLSKTVSISFALQRWDDMAQLVYAAFAINSQRNHQQYQETYDWAFKILDGIPDESRRKVWLEHLKELSQIFDPTKNEIKFQSPDIPTEEEYQIYIQMAEAMGVNLDDPKDDIAQVVKIGLQDLNPERVLKKCKHLFVYVGHYGIPAIMLGLHTAGSKYLRCLKKEVAIGGLSLDSIYDSMFQEHCSKCENKEPWPDSWKWTRSWQIKESEKETHKRFREGLNKF